MAFRFEHITCIPCEDGRHIKSVDHPTPKFVRGSRLTILSPYEYPFLPWDMPDTICGDADDYYSKWINTVMKGVLQPKWKVSSQK